MTKAGQPLMYKHISWRFRKERRNFFHPSFLVFKRYHKFNTREIYLEGATAKFNTRETYLEGATAKFNTRETYLEGANAKFNTREKQKFRGFLEPRNLVPAKFSTFKVFNVSPLYNDLFFISNWLISNSTEIFPKIKQLKNAQYWKFDYPWWTIL